MAATAVRSLPRPRRSPEQRASLPAVAPPPASRAASYQRVLHQLVRRELRMLAETSAWAAVADPARTAALTRHAELIGRVLLHHHTVERDRLWPALRASVPGATPDAERLDAALSTWTASCARIDAQLRDVGTAARQWAVAGTRPARDTFSAVSTSLADLVELQTREEEATLLPLLAVHLGPEEWAAVTRGASAGLSRRERWFVLGAALEDACDGDRARLLSGLPAPTRTAWRVVGHGRYRAAVVRLRGEPPAL